MSKDKSENTFTHLVSGISVEERVILLEKIKQISENLAGQTLESPFRKDADLEIPLSEEIKEEFFLYKVLLWLRSVLKSVPVEKLYEKDRISRLASEISQAAPGLIDFDRRNLTTISYNYLRQLKDCADFFKTYLNPMQENLGAFYVFLGSFILPEITSQINEEADPFSTPPTAKVPEGYRSALIRRIDEILKNIPAVSRNVMYRSVLCIEWLRQFSSLPFDKFLTAFSNIVSDNYICSFEKLGNSFSEFVRVLSYGKSINGETLEALFLFSSKNKNDAKLDEFLHVAGKHLSVLHFFIVSVPVISIAKIVFSDYAWRPDPFGGAEDWFIKFKNEWKKRFDARWEKWLFECKKEEQLFLLKTKFSLNSFPLMPSRPWTEVGDGIRFRYEITGGFINWYLENFFSENIRILKVLQLEGDFTQKNSKELLTGAISDLVTVDSSMKNFNRNLRKDGEIGLLFDMFAKEHLRTIKTQKKIDFVMAGFAQNIKDMKMHLGNAIRALISILQSILGVSENKEPCPIRNLNTICGQRNQSYIAELKKLFTTLTDLLELLCGIELLELESAEA
ncbi:hypothetical protein HRQ91_07730 [Treponema parvum]|uniref:Uncharacterized protein n=1 Tax=Treponema parvum TaxID=138851 RepID=A0A975F4P5_9SPIR|nr:DUF5312 family protein [Treponema parvum]QTQ14350.1 hypothetical protein HRQ91_07730 [Treponema parvum]